MLFIIVFMLRLRKIDASISSDEKRVVLWSKNKVEPLFRKWSIFIGRKILNITWCYYRLSDRQLKRYLETPNAPYYPVFNLGSGSGIFRGLRLEAAHLPIVTFLSSAQHRIVTLMPVVCAPANFTATQGIEHQQVINDRNQIGVRMLHAKPCIISVHRQREK